MNARRMKIVSVTEQQKTKLTDHLMMGRELSRATSQPPDKKIAWIYKCRALLQMLDPDSRRGDRGLIGTLFSQVGDAIFRLSRLRETEPAYAARANVYFEGSVATWETLIDCIEIAPESIVVQTDARKSINPYFLDVPDTQDENLVFVLMPFAESWSDRM